MKNLFREAMDGIGQKVAMQEIRKLIRSSKPEKEKLELIIGIVHAYEEDAERAELEAERRAIEEEEEAERRESIHEMFEGMKAPLDKLVSIAKGEQRDK